MPTITNTVTIAATPEEAWAVLADMPATRQWLPGVVSARMDGTRRVCTMMDGQEVHEQISDVSDETRSYRFTHVRVALPVRSSGGTFTVTDGPVPGAATVTLRTTFEPLEPSSVDQLTEGIRHAFQESLESLRRFCEQKVTWDVT